MRSSPWRDGGLLNFLGHADPSELAALWSTADRQRLAQIALQYDPTDTFGGTAGIQLALTTQPGR